MPYPPFPFMTTLRTLAASATILPITVGLLLSPAHCDSHPVAKSAGVAQASQPSAGRRSEARSKEVSPVPTVDLARYMGRWYEIARYPNSFQDGLVGVIAEYDLNADGTVKVVNSGRKRTLDGPLSKAEAKGWKATKESNSKLYVQFVWPFKADYWIIDLGPNYEYAVVGQPSRRYLWILSRTPQLDAATYDAICRRLRQQGYDPDKLARTPQPPSPA